VDRARGRAAKSGEATNQRHGTSGKTERTEGNPVRIQLPA
jgi:hypothetical protein